MANRNPKYNGRVGVYRTNEIEKYGPICNNSFALPVTTPSIWYKAGPTASTNTNNFNTVLSGNFEFMYDFSGNSRNLTPESVGGFYLKYKYNPSIYNQNNLYYFGVADNDAAYMEYIGAIPCTAGQGTFICVYKNPSTGVQILSLSAQPTQAPFNAITSGYFCSTSTTIIFGDNVSYTFANGATASEWNIRVVSVTSTGNPIVYTNNGVQGATAAYNGTIIASTTNEVAMRTFGGVSVAEYMWWQTPLNLSNCQLVENYLKVKWCLEY